MHPLERPRRGEMNAVWWHTSSEAAAGPRLQRAIEVSSEVGSVAVWGEATSSMGARRHLRAVVVDCVHTAFVSVLAV